MRSRLERDLIIDTRGLFSAEITRSEAVSPACRIVTFSRPEGFPDARPGHFVSVRVSGATAPLLRRPYSVMDLTGESLVLLVKVVGPGSRILAGASPGTVMDIAGPLGGVTFPDPGGEDAVFAGGGTGLAPLIFASRTWHREGTLGKSYLVHGAASSAELLGDYCENDFSEVFRSTMDGSAGFKGDAVTYLSDLIREKKISASRLYSCGPSGMVRALELKVSTCFDSHHTSLEAVMGCGLGACRGCTVPLREGQGSRFMAVCSEGTVVDASTIAWEEWG
ncbi:MAG TPA: FAD-binding oxidoreductase [Candidatus Krumholzibacterium sp.]|nr:FAD-binding oxidoreductase [Candidatus Krumholzibacterium sp.]